MSLSQYSITVAELLPPQRAGSARRRPPPLLLQIGAMVSISALSSGGRTAHAWMQALVEAPPIKSRINDACEYGHRLPRAAHGVCGIGTQSLHSQ